MGERNKGFFLNTVYTVNGLITGKKEKNEKHHVIKDIVPTASSLCTHSRAIRWPLAHMPRCYPLPPSKETHRIWVIPTSGMVGAGGSEPLDHPPSAAPGGLRRNTDGRENDSMDP